MADRTLTVRIIGDSKSLERSFDRSQRSAKGFQAQVVGVNRGLGRLGVATGATIGLAAFFDQARRSTQAASNLNEQVNKSGVVFGQSSRDVLTWSKTTADAFGVSQRAALEAASGFGQILETSGLNQQRAAQMSRSLVELAADIASFNNIDPSEALDKLRSGLAGEAEPLRRVGVLLSEARVQQEAYASGIARQGAKLTEGQKVQARYNLILKDTATAQGDFARTSDSLANKQRKLSANVEELQSRLGEDLVPILSDVIDLLLSAENAASRFAAALNRLPGGTSFKLKDLFGGGIKASDIEELKRQSNLLDAAARGGATDQRLAGITEELEKARQRRVPPDQINRIFDERIARELNRAADGTLPEQIAALDRIEAQITLEIGRVKDVTRKLTLRDQMLAAQRQERAVRQQLAADYIDSVSLGLDRAQLTATFADDLAALDALERAIRSQIAKTGSTVALQRQLISIQSQRNALAEQQREQQKRSAEQAAKARAEARNRRQFLALGLTAEGDERVPGVRALRRRLGTLTDQLTGTFLDTRKTQSVLSRIRKVLSGGLGAVGRDVRSKIQGIFADLNRQLGQHEQATATRFHKASANAILAGLGLSPDQVRALRSRLSQVGAGGTVHAAGVGAFGTIVLHSTTTLDGRVVEQSTTKHQQKRRRRNPTQKRGAISP